MAHRLLRGGEGKKLALLARLMRRHPGELRADFQQYYGLCIDGMGRDFTVHHAAELAAHLPQDARSYVAEWPICAWTLQDQLLARIEYHLHQWNWAHTKDGETGANKPKYLVPQPDAPEKPNDPVPMGVSEMMGFASGLVLGD